MTIFLALMEPITPTGQLDPWMQLLENGHSVLPCSSSDTPCSTAGRRSRSQSRSKWLTGHEVKAILSKEVEPEPNPEEDAFSQAMQRARRLNLPIFDSRRPHGPKSSIEELASMYDVEEFYIGASLEPIRRWLGDKIADRPFPGHGHRWQEMHLIGVVTNSCGKPAGKICEVELIKFALERWPSKCKNIAQDSRGQCMGINFMYMCL